MYVYASFFSFSALANLYMVIVFFKKKLNTLVMTDTLFNMIGLLLLNTKRGNH